MDINKKYVLLEEKKKCKENLFCQKYSCAARATDWSGCARRINSARSATRHSSSLRSSNIETTFRVLKQRLNMNVVSIDLSK